jgi:hypothetical protein
VSLASQPYCRMSLSTSYRSRRPHGSQTTVRTGTRTSDTNATVRPGAEDRSNQFNVANRREANIADRVVYADNA